MDILCFPTLSKTTWLMISTPRIPTDTPEFDEAEKNVEAKMKLLMEVKGKQTVDSFHKRLGIIMWDYVGMARKKKDLKKP